MSFWLGAAAAGDAGFPIAFTAVYVVGFIAAVAIGSIAWYNSKRPAGWEGKERPDFIPDIDKGDSDDSNQTSSGDS